MHEVILHTKAVEILFHKSCEEGYEEVKESETMSNGEAK